MDVTRAKEDFFDRAFKKAFGRIEDYRFKGWNSALGCNVESKDHYRILMKQRGLVPFEAADQLAEEFDKKRPKVNMELSDKAQDIMRSIRYTADKHGNVKLGNRAINALIEIGAITEPSKYEPGYTLQGGFN